MHELPQPWSGGQEPRLPRRRAGALRRVVSTPGGALGLAISVVVIVVALLARSISPFDPEKQNLRQRLEPPAWVEGGSAEHLLGTDAVGRDMLSRVIHGSRISLLVGFVATVLSAALGVTLGLLAGYYRGWVDAVLSRVGDVQQAIPFLVLAIAVAAMLGPGLANLLFVLTITTWVTFFRVVRGEVFSAREEEYVWAARAIGSSNARIILGTILPNVAGSIIIVGTLLMANMIIFEASLSFLGLGVPANIPTWGRIVSDGRQYVASKWWISLFPGLAILITVMGVNLLGDALSEVLDPRQSPR
jgi:peptide/nickel transport system permease protein